jgi:TetR/AcrR family transcriptional repressor of lmrAB and yxaGH operons
MSSKERMIEATAALLQRQGFHATGLNQIVREAKAPKGSLYFHFPGGKEELAGAALEHSGLTTRDEIVRIIGRHRDPGRAIEAVATWLGERLAQSQFHDGCPMATVVLEAVPDSKPLQEICAAHYADWETQIGAYLQAHGLSSAAAADLATLVLASVEGGLLLARARCDASILRRIGAQLRTLVDARLAGPTA